MVQPGPYLIEREALKSGGGSGDPGLTKSASSFLSQPQKSLTLAGAISGPGTLVTSHEVFKTS